MVEVHNTICSSPPQKLLRIMISNICNYQCSFCCWKEDNESSNFWLPDPERISVLLKAAVTSGCFRVMLTGGEPLLAYESSPDKFLSLIRTISSLQGIREFWITSNGKMLSNYELCITLKRSGLKKIVISIPAEDTTKYQKCTNSGTDLEDVFKGIKNVLETGIEVRVDVPLCQEGVRSFEDLESLINKLHFIGVQELAYFALHKTLENASVYHTLNVDAGDITKSFLQSADWIPQRRVNGQLVFTKDTFNVIVPADKILYTKNCKSLNCKEFCQGTYAAYLMYTDTNTVLRSCHHEFVDKRNEVIFEEKLLKNREIESLVSGFRKGWSFAAE